MIYTLKSGVENHPEASVLQQITDLVRKGGVLNVDTDLVAQEHGAGGLIIDILDGHAFIKDSNGSVYPVRIDGTEEVSFAANSSGNPRKDTVILYIDTVNVPAAEGEGEGVAKLKSVAGTPAALPVAPNDSVIQSSIGVNDPWIKIKNVTIASGASGISDENIENIAQRVFLRSYSPINSIDFASTITPDMNDSNQQKVTLTGNITIAEPDNMEAGDWMFLSFLQDATGGRTLTWFSGITWLSPDYSINSSANKLTVYAIQKTGDGSYNGYLMGKNY